MEEQSIFKRILLTIKKYILIIFTLIIGLIRTIFQIEKKDKNKQEVKPTQNIKKQEEKKEIPTTADPATLPDEDNIKTNPHDTKPNPTPIDTEDTNPNTDVVLELPKQKLFKVYTKDNELKYLPLDALLDLIIKEELERIYKVEKFKLKTATTSELIKVEKIKERILPEIIVRVEKETLRTSDVIREEVVIKLEEDLEKNPLFPPRPKIIVKEEQKEKQEEIYSLAHPKKKELKLNEIILPKLKKDEPKTIPTEEKDELSTKLDSINVMMVQTVDEVPKPTIADNLKDAAIIGAVGVAGLAAELILPSEEKQKEEPKEEIVLPKQKEEPTPIEDIKEEIIPETKTEKVDTKDIQEIKTEEIIPEEIKTEPTLTEKEIEKEIKNLEEKDKEQLEELKKQIEEKIQEIKKENEQKKEEEKTTEAPTEAQEEKKYEQEVTEVAEVAENVIEESKTEMKKNDFFEKDYDRIERQIDKMLEDITNTFLRYDGKLSEKQKKKLRAEETKLREAKKDIKYQKHLEIQTEQKYLDEPIRQSELDGLQNELQRIHNENKKEVSDEFLRRMDKLEGMTKEQVANVDKRIMLKRFNKASLLLEMTSLLALPFVRNKHFFYFTVGLIIDNHFNFVNAFFNRKLNRYEPADLEQIRQGQDALNGALDITYKNLVELEYLEQRALARYPELAYDPKFINETTRLRTNLNRRYNNLMRKNKIMEKYRMKSKKHRKILKPELKEKEAA